MTAVHPLFELYAEAAKGQTDAMVYLVAFHDYAHSIDDLVDGAQTVTAETLVALLMKANALYSTPFFLANSAALSATIVQMANTYLDSVHWERSHDSWKRQVADVIRLCGNDMVRTVAFLVGGFPHMRQISLRLREFSWLDQHDQPQPIRAVA